MGLTLAEKIIKDHLVSGEITRGHEIALKIDQTLTQDATGTMAFLEFEAMGIPRVRTELSVAYVDHNMLQEGFENADDHRYLQSAAKKHGIYFSRPGNGICHQVHLERFGRPGKTLLGSDSHTPTAGGLGMLAIGAGGLDVAVAMAGGPYYLTMPRIVRVNLTGTLQPFVSAKDIALEMLRILTVKGGVGAIIEWGGDGARALTVPERATITNMGAELGATCSLFPSDARTLEYLAAQGRAGDYVPLEPDSDAAYDETIEIDLTQLPSLIACPHSPDHVVDVLTLTGTKVDQVCIGSCTNSSLADLEKTAALLKGKQVHPDVSLAISPGSRQVLTMLAESGALADLLAAGARILECACGPCIGMGFAPNSDAVSLRTFNRNFRGRCGTENAGVYLVSPEVAVAAAIFGTIRHPRDLGAMPAIELPRVFCVDDSQVLEPADPAAAEFVQIMRGPNIGPVPTASPLADLLAAPVLLKTGDNVTTDQIMPAGAKVLPFRSNIPKLAHFCFESTDRTFADRARAAGSGIIVGGDNYGQGSSREHAALVPLYLGIRAVIARSFARIHAANLVNAGILPLTFTDGNDYDAVARDDSVTLSSIHDGLAGGRVMATIQKPGGDSTIIPLTCSLTQRQQAILLAGGLLAFTKQEAAK
ncbi:MAG TPA: aconitate hydratase [Clostridiaceae bacterium]|nr:aconitate hydratase [Clostridiaceae bacterium]